MSLKKIFKRMHGEIIVQQSTRKSFASRIRSMRKDLGGRGATKAIKKTMLELHPNRVKKGAALLRARKIAAKKLIDSEPYYKKSGYTVKSFL